MRVVEVKFKKFSPKKALLIVKFISPTSLKNVHIQLFCTGLQPKTKWASCRLEHPDSSQNDKTGCKITFGPWRLLQATL